jgi:hypothetical protein
MEYPVISELQARAASHIMNHDRLVHRRLAVMRVEVYLHTMRRGHQRWANGLKPGREDILLYREVKPVIDSQDELLLDAILEE